MTLPHLRLLLPEHLERLVPARRPSLRFGIPALDAALSAGVPRGQLTALHAPLGSGGTALLMALAETTLRAGEGVALVDAERSLAPQAASHLAELGQFWVVRPRAAQNAWWCADVLLRTGAFGLVIVDRPDSRVRRATLLRLQRLARDRDAALVIRDGETRRRADGQSEGTDARGVRTAAHPYRASVRLCVCALSPADLSSGAPASGSVPALTGWGGAWPAPRALKVVIEPGGAPRAAEVVIGTPLPHRLRPHWAVRDRRAREIARRPERKARK
jgi:hypothetical protein